MTDKPAGVPKKRNRIPLSCESCRIRKLKCDRQKPCLNCTSRDISCVFANTTAAKARPRQGNTTNDELRSKLSRLERLVSAMAENSGNGLSASVLQQVTPMTEDDSSSASEFDACVGQLIEADRGQQYVGPSSWATVLHDIADIREHIENLPYGLDGRDFEPMSTLRNPALLGGVGTDVSARSLLDSLPSRSLSDRLISRFFDEYDPAVPSRQILHKPTFLKVYEQFWATKDEGFCPIFLSQVYALFCLSFQSYHRQGDEPSDLRGKTSELAEIYRKRAAQSLLKTDLTAPTRRAQEALLLVSICEYARLEDGFVGQWFLLGILVRKAMHIGLHREPSEFKSLSPFEQEMRRRLWAHIWQIDMLFSFHLGVPNAVHMFKTNVAPPRNIFEEELTEDMTELPPERPPEENTPISFTIAKHHLMKALGHVVEHLNLLQGYTFDQIYELNTTLQDAYALIPEHLRIQPIEHSLMSPRSLRLQRLQLQMFYDKAACMLNRRFISKSEAKGRAYLRPRQICLESALSLLAIQGRLEVEQNRWWLILLTKHDFLLAATVLYLILFTIEKERSKELVSIPGSNRIASDEERTRITEALAQSRGLWVLHASESSEALQGCRMFENLQSQLESMSAGVTAAQPQNTPASYVPVDTSLTELTIEDMPSESFSLGLDQFAALDSQFAEFDWSSWDASVQGSENETFGNSFLPM